MLNILLAVVAMASYPGPTANVGLALSARAANPVPLIVPCHRVVQAGGRPGNYGGGPEMKRGLLEMEGVLDT